jgi:hypothetical protein
MKSLVAEALDEALPDAGIAKEEIQIAFVGNAAAGLVTGQECVRAQVVLREYGIGGIPMVNVENACASSSTAAHLAWQAVGGGFHDCALVVGMEKLYSTDKAKTFAAFGAAVDVEFLESIKQMLKSQEKSAGADAGASGTKRSMFMDFYAMAAREHMKKYGTTKEQFAAVAAKNSWHGSLNPKAQYREARTVEEVLASPMVAEPLTRLVRADRRRQRSSWRAPHRGPRPQVAVDPARGLCCGRGAPTTDEPDPVTMPRLLSRADIGEGRPHVEVRRGARRIAMWRSWAVRTRRGGKLVERGHTSSAACPISVSAA